MASGAAPMPPPMEMAAPMPASAPMAPARSRSRGVRPQKKKEMAPDAKASLLRDEGRAAEPEPEELEADVGLLAYGRLRLPSVESSRRGRLRLMARTQIYLEVLREERGAVDVDPNVLASFEKKAHAIEAMPDQCHAPTADDGFDYAFAADHAIDLPSDGSFHSLAITEGEATANGRFVVVPRETSDAFRFVALRNPLIGPMLRGPADVYLGDRYLLTRSMKVTPQRGDLELGLGVEEGIKVARNARFEERSAGLMGRALELVHDIDIDVVNLLSKPVLVEIRERIPTARKDDDEVEIREEDVSPGWDPWEPKQGALRGGRRWEIEIQPGQEQKLHATYVIRISAKKELVGGNRREG